MKILHLLRPNRAWLRWENLPFLILGVLCLLSLLSRLILIL